jgi:hypothetical protein
VLLEDEDSEEEVVVMEETVVELDDVEEPVAAGTTIKAKELSLPLFCESPE